MNITEFSDAIGCEIHVTYYPNQGGRWWASFEGAEVKGELVLIGALGNGSTPEEAIKDYIDNIKGRVLVINGGQGDKRREHNVPDYLTCETKRINHE